MNYRTPAEIMSFAAAEALAHIDSTLSPPRSVRETGVRPIVHKAVPDWRKFVDGFVNDEEGKVGVILPASLQTEDFDLDERVSYLTVRQAKGLEFDSVIVVDPQRIVAESPRGYNDLYVALTRATQRLTLVYPED